MKEKIIIKLELELCDRNRNFGEIIESVYKIISERDGVEGFKILEDNKLGADNLFVSPKKELAEKADEDGNDNFINT